VFSNKWETNKQWSVQKTARTIRTAAVPSVMVPPVTFFVQEEGHFPHADIPDGWV
jgi:hypothetical protein